VTKPFLELTVSDMNKIFHVNLHGVFLCYKYAAKHFIKQKTGGKLIATSSVAGFQPFAYLGGYASSKVRSVFSFLLTFPVFLPLCFYENKGYSTP
jgi:short-subunit dehydrogenase